MLDSIKAIEQDIRKLCVQEYEDNLIHRYRDSKTMDRNKQTLKDLRYLMKMENWNFDLADVKDNTFNYKLSFIIKQN